MEKRTLYALALLAMLTACTGDVQPDDAESSPPVSSVADFVEDTTAPDSDTPASEAESVPAEEKKNAATPLSFTVSAAQTVSLSLTLPDGWSIVDADEMERTAEQQMYLYVASPKDRKLFVNADGVCVGAIDCVPYRVDEEDADKPRAIFFLVGLGNDYNFGVYEDARILKTEEHAVGATLQTDVYIAPSIRESQGLERTEKTNRGILSYNRNENVYAAIELESSLVSAEMLDALAHSLTWN